MNIGLLGCTIHEVELAASVVKNGGYDRVLPQVVYRLCHFTGKNEIRGDYFPIQNPDRVLLG